MRDGWETVRVSDVATVVGGGTPKSGVETYWGGDVPWLTPKDLSQKPARYTSSGERSITEEGLKASGARLLPPGSVLLTSRAPVGYVTVASAPIATNQGFKSLVLKDGQVPEFWYYLLGHSTEFLRAHSGGSTFAELSGSALKTLEFTIPPVLQQRRIVDLIGAVDDALDHLTEQGGACRALYSRILGAYMGRREPLRPLSEALVISRVVEIVQPQRTYRIVGVMRSGAGFIDRGEVRGDQIAYRKLWQVRTGQLVMRKLTAWEGPISVVDPEFDGAYVSNEFPVFQVDADRLWPDLLRHMCRWPGLWNLMQQRLVGSVQRRKRLGPAQLLEIALPMDHLEDQLQQTELLDAVWEASEALTAASVAMRRFRSALLGCLLSGEHRIPEAYDQLVGG